MTTVKTDWLPGIAFSAVILAAVIAGFSVIGPPGAQREKKLDARRLSDLQGIAASIDFYYSRHAELPDSLEKLGHEPGGLAGITDPQTGKQYSYTKLSPVTYRLCAIFSGESGIGEARTVWAHDAGRCCFELRAKKIPGL
jgi:hypothetical protein